MDIIRPHILLFETPVFEGIVRYDYTTLDGLSYSTELHKLDSRDGTNNLKKWLESVSINDIKSYMSWPIVAQNKDGRLWRVQSLETKNIRASQTPAVKCGFGDSTQYHLPCEAPCTYQRATKVLTTADVITLTTEGEQILTGRNHDMIRSLKEAGYEFIRSIRTL